MKTVSMLIVAALLAGCASHQGRSGDMADGALLSLEGAAIHYVRLASGLPHDEAVAMLREREPHFRGVPGLVQKIYGHDPATGEFCGIYIFQSPAALEAFRQSELARTIGQAYQAESVRIERYDLLRTLYPGLRRAQ